MPDDARDEEQRSTGADVQVTEMSVPAQAAAQDDTGTTLAKAAESAVREEDVLRALGAVHDPELPLNIVDLGLVYRVEIHDRRVEVDVTHTALGCPAMEMMREDIETAVRALPGVSEVQVQTVWDPPWNKGRLTPRGRAALLAYGISV